MTLGLLFFILIGYKRLRYDFILNCNDGDNVNVSIVLTIIYYEVDIIVNIL